MHARTTDNLDVRKFLGRFVELYRELRFGATYVIKRPRDPVTVRLLLSNFPYARLEQLAVELLTSRDPWIGKTDRGIGILCVKASWLDGVLCERAAKAEKPKSGAYAPYVPLSQRKEA